MRDTKTIVLCDPHGAYYWREALEEVLQAEHDCDRIVIAGDVMDAQSLSRYADLKTCSLRDDLAAARECVRLCAEVAPTDVLEGNHDRRWAKYIATHTIPDVQSFLPDSLLEHICGGIRHARISGEAVTPLGSDGMMMGFLLYVGDCVVGHAESASKLICRGAENFAAWLGQWRMPLGLPPFRALVQAHTHRMVKAMMQGGYQMLIEGGCMMRLNAMSYGVETGNLKYSPPTRGYVRLCQTNGVTDINATTYIVMGVSAPSAATPSPTTRVA